MRQIRPSLSIQTFWEDLVFLEAALLASPEVEHLAAPVTALLEEASGLMTQDLATTRARLQAKAKGAIADGTLDEGLGGLHNDVLHHAGQNRKDVAFTTLFKERLSKLIRYGLRRQIQVVEGVLKALTLPVIPAALAEKHTATLSDLLTKARAVLGSVEQTELDAMRLRLNINAWKQDTNAARTALYGELLSFASSSKRPRQWVERFFKPADDTSTDTDTASPAEPSAE